MSHFAIEVLVRSKLGGTENLYQCRVTNVIAALFKFMRCSEYLPKGILRWQWRVMLDT